MTRFQRGTDRATGLRRRLSWWSAAVTGLRGARPRDEFWLLASAIADLSLALTRGAVGDPPMALRDLDLVVRSWRLRFRVRADTDDLYHVIPRRERDVHDAIVGAVHTGDVAIDVGANIGYYTLALARLVGPGGHLIAVEPLRATREVLEHNLRRNQLEDRVDVHGVAVGDVSGGQVAIQARDGLFGRARTTAPRGPGDLVRVHTLDRICAAVPHVRLLKLDVEGSELTALKGASELLERTDIVVVEANLDGAAIRSVLVDAGFEVTELRFTRHLLASRRRTRP